MNVRLIVVGIALVLTTSLWAQESPQELSFGEAVKIGLSKNVLLNQQKNQLLVNQSQKLTGVSNFIPSLNLTGQANRTQGQQQNTTTGDLEDLTTEYAGLQLNANLTVFNGFRNVNTFSQANNQLLAQSYLVKRSSQDVISNVATQYLQVLLDQELLRIAQENFEAQKVLYDQIKGFFDVGSRAITDVYNQDAQMKSAQVAMVRARNTLDNDKALLAQTLQLDPTVSFSVNYPQLVEDILLVKTYSLDSLQEFATVNRADLEQMNYQVKANKAAYQSTFGGFVPRVNVFANYGSFYYSLIPQNFSDQFVNFNPSLTYGLNLTVPIFGRFQSKTQRVTSRVAYDNSLLNKQNLEKTVKIDVQRTYNNLVNAIENYHSSLAQAEAGRVALEAQRESYELGIASQVALAQANQTFVQGVAAKAQAEVTLVFQKIQLDYATGALNTEDFQ